MEKVDIMDYISRPKYNAKIKQFVDKPYRWTVLILAKVVSFIKILLIFYWNTAINRFLLTFELKRDGVLIFLGL